MFRNRSTAASIRNIFLWKLISSLSFPFNIPLSIIVPSFRFRLLLHCITLIYRSEKNSRLKKKNVSNRRMNQRIEKLFPRQFRITVQRLYTRFSIYPR